MFKLVTAIQLFQLCGYFLKMMANEQHLPRDLLSIILTYTGCAKEGRRCEKLGMWQEAYLHYYGAFAGFLSISDPAESWMLAVASRLTLARNRDGLDVAVKIAWFLLYGMESVEIDNVLGIKILEIIYGQHQDACIMLAYCWRMGYGCEQQFGRALDICANLHHPYVTMMKIQEERYSIPDETYKAPGEEAALAKVKHWANKDRDPHAAYMLSQWYTYHGAPSYVNGRSFGPEYTRVRKDYRKQGFEWTQRAALVGHAAAQETLACFYKFAWGRPCDEDLAEQWWERASKQNHPREMGGHWGDIDADCLLPRYLAKGEWDKAIAALNRSIRGGNSDSVDKLANLLRDRPT